MPTLGALGGTSNKGFLPARTLPGTGLNPSAPGASAKALQSAYGYTTDGIYWINVNSQSTPVYCIMNPAVAGGGWMMIMKATTGNTFQYSSPHWTTATTLNPGDTTRNNADAKFNTFNYTPGTDLLAIFPDSPNQGGSISVSGYNWTWYQPSFGSASGFNSGQAISALQLFGGGQPTTGGNSGSGGQNWGGTGWYIQRADTYAGWNNAGAGPNIFSSQTDIHFYGFNYSNYGNSNANVRWGFGWNENSEGYWPSNNVAYIGTNDVTGGIGLNYAGTPGTTASAGDYYNCCQNVTGLNRSMRVEMYIR